MNLLLPLIAALPLSPSPAPNTAEAPAAEVAAAEQQPLLTPEERALFTRWNNSRHLHSPQPKWQSDEPRSLFSTRLITENGRPTAYEQRVIILAEDGMALTTLTRRAAIGKTGFTYTKEERRAMALKGLNNDAAAPYTFVREPDSPGEVEVESWQVEPSTRELLRVTRRRCNIFRPDDREHEQVVWEKPVPYSEAGVPLVRIEQRLDPKDVDYWPNPAQNPQYALSPDGKHMVYAFENSAGAIHYVFDIFTREGDAWVQEPQTGNICTRWCGLDYEMTDDGIIGIIVDDELELVLTTFIPYATGGRMSYRATHEEQHAPLQQLLKTYAHNSRTQDSPSPEVMEKGRAIWEGKQSAAPEDFAAFSIYARAALSRWCPEYRVNADQSIILCYMGTMLEGNSQLLQRFGVFHRVGDRFICKNRYDFYSYALCDLRKIAFEPEGVVLHFHLQQDRNTPELTVSLTIHYDTPWDKSYLLCSTREAERLSDKLSWRFVHAVEQMDTATIDEFIRNGYTLDQTMPDQLHEDHGEECLFFRVLRWCTDEELARALPYLLQHVKQDLNAQDKDGETALSSVLSYEGKPQAIKILLDAGANPNLTGSSSNQTPLMLAACRMSPLSVKHLLDAGADVHARDYRGYTPMHWLMSHSRWCRKKDEKGNWEKRTKDICADMLETARLLVAAGADINAAADTNGQPPIFLLLHNRADTLEEGILALLPELVKLGVRLTQQDAAGKTFADHLPEHFRQARALVDSLLAETKD